MVDHTYPGAGPYTAVVTASNSVSADTAETIVVEKERQRMYLPLLVNSISLP